jgi:predicted permease
MWATRWLFSMFPVNLNNIDIPRIDSIPISGPVLFFSLFITAFTGIIFGVAPSFRRNLLASMENLKGGGASVSSSRATRWVRHALVVSEIAIAVIVLISASLLVRSFLEMHRTPYGFDGSNVLSMYITMSPQRYPTDKEQRVYMNQLLQELSNVGGVESAAGIGFMPLSGYNASTDFNKEGAAIVPGQSLSSAFNITTPRYFETMGIPLEAGRDFTENDREGNPEVGIISREFQKRYYPNEDPLLKRINVGTVEKPEWVQIIGIVADVKGAGLDQPTEPELYVNFAQSPNSIMGFVMKTRGEPTALASAVRQAVWWVNKDQPVQRMVTMQNSKQEATAIRRMTMLLLGMFAIVAVALAFVGTYGVLSQGVTQRTQEIGVRMALGASPSRVLRMVMSEGARLAAMGSVLGVLCALAVSKLVRSFLVGVSEHDLTSFTFIPLLLMGVAMLACLIPATRATRVDPMIALRQE